MKQLHHEPTAPTSGAPLRPEATVAPEVGRASVDPARRARSIQYHIDHGKAACPVCHRSISNGLPMLNHLRTHRAEGVMTERLPC